MQNSNKETTIWLAYVSYPVTTAVYFERALRKHYRVITCGPHITEDLVKHWNLENMNLPIIPQDISLENEPDMEKIFEMTEPKDRPDLLIWIESVHGYYPKNIKNLKIPTVCYLIDSHINLEMHLQWAQNFDYVFTAQREYIPEFKRHGIESIFWLPLGCDPEIHDKFSKEKEFEIGFVGSISNNPRREKLLSKLSRRHLVYYERCFWKDMSNVFSKSKIVFNNAINKDMNMRVFEVMSIGSLLLTDRAENSGQEELFVNGEDYVVYDDENLGNTAEFYLENPELRESIAQRGKEIVRNAHQYENRIHEIMNVALNNSGSTPTAQEWRLRSLKNISISTNHINKLKRSFVIPVLDYSPASKYNINTLLADLEEIEGNVIVIFNSVEVAEEIKNHKRIDYYAVMNKNVGVARAWNIGLNISQTPITFIINSDLHLTPDPVQKLESGLINFPMAAITGVQGSFFHFKSASDLAYFDKGTINSPMEVDAVSGFFFAVKTKYFNSGLLKFENRFTPCYFEEWDMGLQVKKNGLKCYMLPSTGYDHIWSGSIRALKTIKYLDKEETAGEILDRNRQIFWSKWEEIAKSNETGIFSDLLESKWVELANSIGEDYILNNQFEEAEKVFLEINEKYPGNPKILTNLGVVQSGLNRQVEAVNFLKKALEIDPSLEPAKENLELLMP